jgi:hypothetical protein
MSQNGRNTQRPRDWDLLWILVVALVVLTIDARGNDRAAHAAGVCTAVYVENGGPGDWAPLLAEEPDYLALSAEGAITRGRLLRGFTKAVLSQAARIIVSLEETADLAAFRLVPLRTRIDERSFTVAKMIPLAWHEMGENLYELVLQEPLAPGEYALLGPSSLARPVWTFQVRR